MISLAVSSVAFAVILDVAVRPSTTGIRFYNTHKSSAYKLTSLAHNGAVQGLVRMHAACQQHTTATVHKDSAPTHDAMQ